MRKRLLSVPLALCMLLALLSGTALAADETGGNYYHWDFTKQSAYVFGLEKDGTTSKKEPVRVRSASDSPELHWTYGRENKSNPNKIYWVSNDTLVYSSEGVCRPTGKTISGFHLVSADGEATSIDMTRTNGFKLEITMNMSAGDGASYVLGPGDGGNGLSGHDPGSEDLDEHAL